jgi:hypothetical protein
MSGAFLSSEKWFVPYVREVVENPYRWRKTLQTAPLINKSLGPPIAANKGVFIYNPHGITIAQLDPGLKG